ncbi:Dephospho-CoA kinase domain-containing protein [Trichoplax sp. H2]|nr:Dephospho-CoA kinase domain-containing protein [Trichoplax sp. H2]|eukprot:RDD38576.1 Dephospho-CoA kinase domain-containing protein [Trichoplax sp. H2]
MFLVGLTGGIASGKSTVCKTLQELGCWIIDADALAREVVLPQRPAWSKIVQAFGQEVLEEDGQLNRQRLGDIIFKDPQKRKLLNSITHPAIQKQMLWLIFKAFLTGEKFVVLDIPLLYEGGKLLKYLNRVIVVYCSRSQQLERLMKRNELTLDQANSRIDAQLDIEQKRQKADIIIDNTKSEEETIQQVRKVYFELNHSWSHWKLRLLLIGMLFSSYLIFQKVILT